MYNIFESFYYIYDSFNFQRRFRPGFLNRRVVEDFNWVATLFGIKKNTTKLKVVEKNGSGSNLGWEPLL